MSKNANNLEALEVKVAFLEESLIHLSDEYYRQQKELDTLKKQYAILAVRDKNPSGDEGGAFDTEDERPPHY